MTSRLRQVAEFLGDGWQMYWGPPPPGGIYILKDVYMSDPGDVEAICRQEGFVVVYITAAVRNLYITYGRVRPGVFRCPAATFIRRFDSREVKIAARTLVEFVLKVERLPLFQINPEVLRFADLCQEYLHVCEEPEAVIKRLEERPLATRQAAGGGL
ncbi:MAG: hypothetical protein ACK4M3_02515, partial [Pyrobaculum sp.]